LNICFSIDPQTPKWGLKSASKNRLDVEINLKDQVLKPPFGGLGVIKEE